MSFAQNPASSFAVLSIHSSDIIRLLQFPEPISDTIGSLIRASWPPGIQSERFYGESYEYKLKGRPFGVRRGQEAVGSRRLVRDILALLYRRGWVLASALNHSRHPGTKDSLIFRHQPLPAGGPTDDLAVILGTAGEIAPEAIPSSPRLKDAAVAARSGQTTASSTPTPVDWLVVALSWTDRVRIIYDAPPADKRLNLLGAEFGEADEGSSGAFTHSERSHDELGILVQSLKMALADIDYFQSGEWNYDSFEFKCKGTPWLPMGLQTVKARLLILRLAETLDRFGWRSYTSLRQRSESDDSRAADTWYFVRARSWAVGRAASSGDP